ncbi:unnamed protein product [Cuscuta epithymum]|uniref:U-box domain-containing protein n=1 Tax=Cuscuta epithymum TaxID=186058 RepID=A0AAV0E2T1_9ASTE|nr:unnamed protein product [Cuscuta epithymum]
MRKMNQVEIPQYFLCPISLQIMKDPVIAVTGITYDRESIEKWLSTAEQASCPVTKQPLVRDAELTPNHMLRRLIQDWCTSNPEKGIDRIPSPKTLTCRSEVLKLIRDLNSPETFMESLKKMEELASEGEKTNRKCMEEAGVVKSMVLLIVKRFRERETQGLQEALKIFGLVCSPSSEDVPIVNENHEDLIQVILWILKMRSLNMDDHVKVHAMNALKTIIEVLSSNHLEGLNLEFFKEMVSLLRAKSLTQQTTKASLHVLIQASKCGRNKLKIIEAGVVFELIELELCNPGNRISELVFCLLAQLCSIADGRQQFLKHAGSIAVVSKRTLRVSPATDDRAVQILSMISRCSATKEVTAEMLRVGAVAKLCMVLQADCEVHLKKKAREILRLHSNVWNNSPCIQYALSTTAR